MKKLNMEDFSYKNFSNYYEIELLLNTSNPLEIKKLNFIDARVDFNLGEFIFNFKSVNNNIYSLSFIGDNLPLNSFWYLLEALTKKEDLIFCYFYKNYEIILNIKKQGQDKIRYTFLDTKDLVIKVCENKIFKYSYADCTIREDIVMNKKDFIKDFYFILQNVFKNYNNIAYFEPPLINYNLWIKDSKIISKYLNL